MYSENIEIIDDEGVVENSLIDENEAMDRYLELVEEGFEFKGTIKIIKVLRELN